MHCVNVGLVCLILPRCLYICVAWVCIRVESRSAKVIVLVCVQNRRHGPVMALLNIKAGVSRVHASRRFFEQCARHDVDIPVIHMRSFPKGAAPDAYSSITTFQPYLLSIVEHF